MAITLTKEKKDKISKICRDLRLAKNPTIRTLAKVIGNLVASFPAVMYGRLHYRKLENDKIESLKKVNQNFNGSAIISKSAQQEFYWWQTSIQFSYNDQIRDRIFLILSEKYLLK